MKKNISLLLILLMLAAMMAGCGGNGKETTGGTNEGKADVPASSLEVLENIWALYDENDIFPIVGGDTASHMAQMEKDETYVMPSAPGKFALTEGDELTFKMLVPGQEQSKLTDAATMTHMMNSNNFSCGVYRVSAADADSFSAAMKTAVSGNQWICGMPERLLIAVIAEEYVLVAWGVEDAMGPFTSKLTSAYPDAKLVVNEAIAG